MSQLLSSSPDLADPPAELASLGHPCDFPLLATTSGMGYGYKVGCLSLSFPGGGGSTYSPGVLPLHPLFPEHLLFLAFWDILREALLKSPPRGGEVISAVQSVVSS